MLTYSFTARDPKTGHKITSEVQAENEQAAVKAIKAQGYAPLEVQLGGQDAGGLAARLEGIRTKDKVIFSRQLSTLINAGLPLVQSLKTVENQTANKQLKKIIAEIIEQVEGGAAFSDALSRYPKVFNRVYVSLIAAGETSGTLDKTLERLANQQEKDAEILGKVRGALIYPLLVLLVMVGVLTFMLTAVVPHVQELYSGIPGAKLPFITSILLSFSHLISNFWWLVLLLLIGGGIFAGRWAKTDSGKEAFDQFKMHGWPVNHLFMKMYMARLARTAQALVASGVPLLQVIEITGDAVGNVHIKRSLDKAGEKIKGGKSFSESIADDPNFLDLVPNMIQIGEQSGAMESMLGKTADYFEKEVDNEIKNISTLVEPVMMIGLGIAALIIVAAVLLPIYSLAGKFQT